MIPEACVWVYHLELNLHAPRRDLRYARAA